MSRSSKFSLRESILVVDEHFLAVFVHQPGIQVAKRVVSREMHFPQRLVRHKQAAVDEHRMGNQCLGIVQAFFRRAVQRFSEMPGRLLIFVLPIQQVGIPIVGERVPAAEFQRFPQPVFRFRGARSVGQFVMFPEVDVMADERFPAPFLLFPVSRSSCLPVRFLELCRLFACRGWPRFGSSHVPASRIAVFSSIRDRVSHFLFYHGAITTKRGM